MNPYTFKRVLDESGFNKSELAVLYGVSRQTIHTWAGGGAPRPDSYTARMAASITKALCIAINKRLLPFGAMDRERRLARIKRMAKSLQELTPAPA